MRVRRGVQLEPKNVTLCKGKKAGVRKLQEEEFSEEDVGRVETVAGVTREGEEDSRIRVSLGVKKQRGSLREVKIKLLADTGVRRTILSLWDWEKLGGGELKKTVRKKEHRRATSTQTG